MRFSKFNVALRGLPSGECAVYNTLTGGLVVLDDRIASCLERGETGGLEADEAASLEEMGVLVHGSVDEDRLLDLFYNQIRFSGRLLSITLLTTMNCNFACPYCYEGDLTRGKKQMTDETAAQTIEWIKARAKEMRAAEIEIQYHGGEPLLNVPAIEKIGRELDVFCREKGIKLSAHMSTNGYLLDRPTAERIKAAGVASARVTLDGPADVHDGRRFLKGGGKTFGTIVKNLLDVKDILRLSIGINYTKETAGRIPGFLDELTALGLGPGEIARVGCSPVMPGEGGALFDSGCVPADDLYDDLPAMQEEIVRRGYWRHEAPEPAPCPVVMAGHYTINYDGTLCKCPAVADRPEYAVGHVGKELAYNAEMYRCMGHDTFENGECRNCSLLPLCFGGCRYLALVEKGEFHEIDCRKKHLENYVRTAVERMLKEDGA